MNGDTLLSIIIPCYNCEKYIEECVLSLNPDGQPDIQIILVDDGSVDDTLARCNALAQQHKNIEVVHTDNFGVSHARNMGLNLAKGIWIMFVDSDDTVEKNYMDTLRNGVPKEVDLIRFGICCRYVDETGKLLKTENRTMKMFQVDSAPYKDWSFNESFKLLFHENVFDSVCGAFFEREIIDTEKLRFDETVSVREDSIFMLKYAAKVKSVRYINQYLYNYRIVGNEGYHYRRAIPIDNILKLYNEYIDFLGKRNQGEIGVQQAVDHHVFQQLVGGVIHCASRKYNVPLAVLFKYIKNISTEFEEMLNRIEYDNTFFKVLVDLIKNHHVLLATIMCKLRYYKL